MFPFRSVRCGSARPAVARHLEAAGRLICILAGASSARRPAERESVGRSIDLCSIIVANSQSRPLEASPFGRSSNECLDRILLFHFSPPSAYLDLDLVREPAGHVLIAHNQIVHCHRGSTCAGPCGRATARKSGSRTDGRTHGQTANKESAAPISPSLCVDLSLRFLLSCFRALGSRAKRSSTAAPAHRGFIWPGAHLGH